MRTLKHGGRILMLNEPAAPKEIESLMQVKRLVDRQTLSFYRIHNGGKSVDELTGVWLWPVNYALEFNPDSCFLTGLVPFADLLYGSSFMCVRSDCQESCIFNEKNERLYENFRSFYRAIQNNELV